MNITTRHFATIQFTFNDGVSLDKQWSLRDVFQEEIDSISQQYHVVENTDFRCWFEGYEIESDDISELEKAVKDFMVVFQTYGAKHVTVIT